MNKITKLILGGGFFYVAYQTRNIEDSTITFILGIIGLILFYLALRREKPERKAIPESVKREVLKRQNGTCALCEHTKFLHFHHKKKVEDGGNNDINNIVGLCPNHHSLAHAKEAKVDYKA